MGSISRMNQRSRLFEENEELMSKLEAQYESIGAKDVYWDDESEPYIELVGNLALQTIFVQDAFSALRLPVTFCKIYCDGEYVDEDEFREQLESEHERMNLFLKENAKYLPLVKE